MTTETEQTVSRVAASYRDPSGQVFIRGERIFRTVTDVGAKDYEYLRDSGILSELQSSGDLVESKEVTSDDLGLDAAGAIYILEHPKIDFISYPYEWPFAALKAAALFHLKLQIDLLDKNIMFSDASAYNIQFIGARPIFIDVLSLRTYKDGEYWHGHKQFCEQFLNPLLLRACCGVPHNSWFRGNPEGISTAELSQLIPARHKLSPQCLMHIVLPAWLQKKGNKKASVTSRKLRPLPKNNLLRMLRQISNWIEKLNPPRRQRTIWDDYTLHSSYSSEQAEAKIAFISDFVSSAKPRVLADLGCNNGEYAELALANGAKKVVGLDADPGACDAAFKRACERELSLNVIQTDLANLSPAQGWLGLERQALGERLCADSMLALALLHHLVIGRNIPLPAVVDWLLDVAPQGVIEFVDKTDPQIARMLRFREDIFPGYDLKHLHEVLERRAKVVRECRISQSRTLIWFHRI